MQDKKNEIEKIQQALKFETPEYFLKIAQRFAQEHHVQLVHSSTSTTLLHFLKENQSKDKLLRVAKQACAKELRVISAIADIIIQANRKSGPDKKSCGPITVPQILLA